MAIALPFFLIFILGYNNMIGIRPDLLKIYSVYFVIALVGFYASRYFKLHFFRANAKNIYAFFVLLLIITFIIGFEVKGSKRWIDFYFFQLQPSEPIKIFSVIFFADQFSRMRQGASHAGFFIKNLIYALIPTFIIFMQPDLGTSMVVFLTFLVMVLHSDIPKKYVASFIGICIALTPIFWIFLKDYQRNRVLSMIDPSLDPSGTAYNMTQAIISVGSGGLFGKGLGLGKQSQLNFLPEFHTDFAFSSFIEQFGFMSGVLLIALYAIGFWFLFQKIINLSREKDDAGRFHYFYVLGFTTILIVQTCINIGMNVGMLPIAGITLPFISYGGSSLLTLFFGLGLAIW